MVSDTEIKSLMTSRATPLNVKYDAPQEPPGNVDKANSVLSFEESDKSKLYVFPTYNVRSGVITDPDPVSIKIFVPRSVTVLKV